MHLLRAESPGPQVGKLVSKMNVTARILYLIYLCITIIEFLILWIGPDPQMNFFHSITTALATAGTGGFAILNTGFATYSIFSQYVVSIFMIIFGLCRAGNLIKFIPYTITTGFTAGIAVTSAIGQIKDFIRHALAETFHRGIEGGDRFSDSRGGLTEKSVAVFKIAVALLDHFLLAISESCIGESHSCRRRQTFSRALTHKGSAPSHRRQKPHIELSQLLNGGIFFGIFYISVLNVIVDNSGIDPRKLLGSAKEIGIAIKLCGVEAVNDLACKSSCTYRFDLIDGIISVMTDYSVCPSFDKKTNPVKRGGIAELDLAVIERSEGGLKPLMHALSFARTLIDVKLRVSAIDVAVQKRRFTQLTHTHFDLISVAVISHPVTSLFQFGCYTYYTKSAPECQSGAEIISCKYSVAFKFGFVGGCGDAFHLFREKGGAKKLHLYRRT